MAGNTWRPSGQWEMPPATILCEAARVISSAVHPDASSARPDQPLDCPEGGCLPGAVGADQGDDLPALDMEGHPPQCRDGTVADVDVLQFKHFPIFPDTPR